jgi:hypothetical protein
LTQIAIMLLLGACARRTPPPPEDLARAFAGKGEDGYFWLPTVNDHFPEEDLLAMPNGTYITHLHERPNSSGRWSIVGDVLTLDGWYGEGPFVLQSLRIQGDDLTATSTGGAIFMQRLTGPRPFH